MKRQLPYQLRRSPRSRLGVEWERSQVHNCTLASADDNSPVIKHKKQDTPSCGLANSHAYIHKPSYTHIHTQHTHPVCMYLKHRSLLGRYIQSLLMHVSRSKPALKRKGREHRLSRVLVQPETSSRQMTVLCQPRKIRAR